MNLKYIFITIVLRGLCSPSAAGSDSGNYNWRHWEGIVGKEVLSWQLKKIEDYGLVRWNPEKSENPPLSPGKAALIAQKYAGNLINVKDYAITSIEMKQVVGIDIWIYIVEIDRTKGGGVSSPLRIGVKFDGTVVEFKKGPFDRAE